MAPPWEISRTDGAWWRAASATPTFASARAGYQAASAGAGYQAPWCWAAGVVEEVRKAFEDVRRGDHVVLSYQSCGHCPPCKRGHPGNCRHFFKLNFGFARLDGSNALAASGVRGHFFGQSAFATHALATKRDLVKVAKTLPLNLLAPLGCGLQTGAGTSMNALAVKAGASVAVFGTGSVGLAAVMATRIVNADPIIAIDIIPRRLEVALELGAAHSIEPATAPSGPNLMGWYSARTASDGQTERQVVVFTQPRPKADNGAVKFPRPKWNL